MNVEKYTQEFLERLVKSLVEDDVEKTWVEFKENCADKRRLGNYISGLSNAALLANQQFGYIVYGVEDGTRRFKGTSFNPLSEKAPEGGDMLINWLHRGLKNSAIGFDVYEVTINGAIIRLFEIEAAKVRPTLFYGDGYCRIGSSLVHLRSNFAIEREIYNHLTADWTARTIPGLGWEEALDPNALRFAREQYYEKHKDDVFADEIMKWDNDTFLNKASLSIEGKLTFAAIILLGRSECEHWISPSVARITWQLMREDGSVLDYVHFKPPMILAVEGAFRKIRNLTLREMPDGTLFPRTLPQYDRWVFREALHNCIAHQDYGLGHSISIVEYPEKIELSNVGRFEPGSVDIVLSSKGRPRYYRNRQLVDAMVELKMIDTVGLGIKTMFSKQRDRAMPLPDYVIEDKSVKVVIPGRVIDSRYSNLLLGKTSLPIEKVMLLDRLQKGVKITRDEAKLLREDKLIEGRYPYIYPSLKVASTADVVDDYLNSKGFDTKFYKQRILEFLCVKGSASIGEVVDALDKFLPKSRPIKANKRRIVNLLSVTMGKKDGLVYNSMPRQSKWALTEKGAEVCRAGNSSCKRICHCLVKE